jgi:dTDP-4-amino-4,6-dideoxygalactose transaminase
LGDAGAFVTNDHELAAKLRSLRVYGWGAKYHCTMTGGMNSRMDELQAAVLRTKLPHLDRWNRRRREIAARYKNEIRHPAIAPSPFIDDGSDIAHLYVVRVRLARVRCAIISRRRASRPTFTIRSPIIGSPGPGILPPEGLARTDRACYEVLSLPCYPELTDAEADVVIAACNRWQPAIRS